MASAALADILQLVTAATTAADLISAEFRGKVATQLGSCTENARLEVHKSRTSERGRDIGT